MRMLKACDPRRGATSTTAARTRLAGVALAGLLALGLLFAWPAPAQAEIDVAGWTFKDLASHNVRIGFDLAFDARPGEPVHAAGLSPAAVLERLGVH